MAASASASTINSKSAASAGATASSARATRPVPAGAHHPPPGGAGGARGSGPPADCGVQFHADCPRLRPFCGNAGKRGTPSCTPRVTGGDHAEVADETGDDTSSRSFIGAPSMGRVAASATAASDVRADRTGVEDARRSSPADPPSAECIDTTDATVASGGDHCGGVDGDHLSAATPRGAAAAAAGTLMGEDGRHRGAAHGRAAAGSPTDGGGAHAGGGDGRGTTRRSRGRGMVAQRGAVPPLALPPSALCGPSAAAAAEAATMSTLERKHALQ